MGGKKKNIKKKDKDDLGDLDKALANAGWTNSEPQKVNKNDEGQQSSGGHDANGSSNCDSNTEPEEKEFVTESQVCISIHDFGMTHQELRQTPRP